MFFSLPHGRGFIPQSLREALKSKWCVGASRGWLVLLRSNHKGSLKSPVQLLNPLSGASFMLPPLNETDKPGQRFAPAGMPSSQRFLPSHFKAAIAGGDLGSSPSSCIVMMRSYYRLGFCRPGDVCWTMVRTLQGCLRSYFFKDVISLQGSFYVGAHFVGLGALHSALLYVDPNCGSSLPTREEVIQMPRNWSLGSMYLVASSSQLLLIHKLFSDGDANTVEGFDVFQLDRLRGEWMQVHSIGEHMIFIGMNESVSISSRDHPAWKPNCIYYTHLFVHCKRVFSWGYVIFDLADGKMEFFKTFKVSSLAVQPMWVVQGNGSSSSSPGNET